MSTFNEDEDLDQYAERIAQRAAVRESKLKEIAMKKRQQLENDEEEFRKSKKHATQASSVTTNVNSTYDSKVKSPQKPTTIFNYSSPSKNQFLPSFNSPQRSFVLTKSINKSPLKSPQKDFSIATKSIENDDLTPVNSAKKQQTNDLPTTPLQSTNRSSVDICSPKPFQKSPVYLPRSPFKSFICHSPSQATIASNFSKKVVDFSPHVLKYDNVTNSDIVSKTDQSSNKFSALSQTTTPTKSSNQALMAESEPSFKPKPNESTNSTQKCLEFGSAKRSISPVRLFSTVKSSNPIKVISPIKQHVQNTPERLCVLDKKKLFENAIKEETENAKRVQEQREFLLRKKFPCTNSMTPESSMPKKIKTSIFEFDNKLVKESPTTTKIDAKAESIEQQLPVDDQCNTEPKILDVEMKQLPNDNDYSIAPDDEISKFIDQVEETIIHQPVDKSFQFENSLHSIAEENCDENGGIVERMVKQLSREDELKTQAKLVKSDTKTNLYPNLSDLNKLDECQTIENSYVKSTESDNNVDTIKILSPNKQANVSTLLNQQEVSKPTTPMRTLSQYRREQKQRVANTTPLTKKMDIEKAQFKEEIEKARFVIYQNKLKKKLDQMKLLVETYEKAIEQSSNAIALCLKNPDQRGSSSQLAAEKILLISTQRYSACKNEIQLIESKLKSSKLPAPETPLATGCVSIERISLLVKSDFIVGQINDQDPLNHHFICLARCGERVLETEILDSSTAIENAAITFELNKLQFDDLDKDFQIQFELYGLALQKEKHHHDKKSMLINSIKIPPLSPKLSRSKKTANHITYSVNQGFTRLGFVKFNWNNIQDHKYELDEFLINSPFTGQIEVDFQMKAVYNPEIELEDFLNEYDGKYWKSRYYVMKNYLLAYWQYREDYTDKNLPSLGTIDLRNCVNRKVGPVSLNVCARSHSFVLVTKEEIVDRERKTKDNKLHKITEQKTYTFAADSKEDCDKWCEHFNKLLPLIRIWECSAQPPLDLKFLEQQN